jgi:hypothetical protein
MTNMYCALNSHTPYIIIIILIIIIIIIWLTVHRWGFSPVCRLIWTTNMYCALNGLFSRLHSFHRHTNDFLLAWMWSWFICWKTNTTKMKNIIITCLANWALHNNTKRYRKNCADRFKAVHCRAEVQQLQRVSWSFWLAVDEIFHCES